MGHILAPKAQHHTGHRRVANLGKRREAQRRLRLDRHLGQPEAVPA